MDTRYGQSTELFGHADYYAARQKGTSNQDILDWVNANLGTGRYSPGQGNQPGGGGLYDMIAKNAMAERQAEQLARQRQQEIQRQEQLQREAQERQAERLRQMEIKERTQAANTARADQKSSLQIKSQSKPPGSGGTQGFKRRKLQVNPTAYSAIAGGQRDAGVINV